MPDELRARVALSHDERLSLAEQMRVAFDTPPDQRVIQDTWIYAAAMAEAWYVQVAPHNPNGPVAMAASLQAAACIPNVVLMEYLMADPPWRKQVVTHDATIDSDGYLRIPDTPGIGLDLVEEEIAKHPYRPRTLNFFSEESVLERPIVPRE